MHSAPPPVFRVLFMRKLQLSSRRQRRRNPASLHACAIQHPCMSAAASLHVSRGIVGCLFLGCLFLGCLPRLPCMVFFAPRKHEKGLRPRLPCRDTGGTPAALDTGGTPAAGPPVCFVFPAHVAACPGIARQDWKPWRA
jgi:hypothetical protein